MTDTRSPLYARASLETCKTYRKRNIAATYGFAALLALGCYAITQIETIPVGLAGIAIAAYGIGRCAAEIMRADIYAQEWEREIKRRRMSRIADGVVSYDIRQQVEGR